MSVWIWLGLLIAVVILVLAVRLVLANRANRDHQHGLDPATTFGSVLPPELGVPARVPAESIVRNGLRALLERDDADGFVVFEDKASKKFVQFAGGASGFALDFPLNDLSEAEVDQVKGFFESRGFELTNYGPAQPVFRLDFGKDVNRATETAMAIFREVHRLPQDIRLLVHTD